MFKNRKSKSVKNSAKLSLAMLFAVCCSCQNASEDEEVDPASLLVGTACSDDPPMGGLIFPNGTTIGVGSDDSCSVGYGNDVCINWSDLEGLPDIVWIPFCSCRCLPDEAAPDQDYCQCPGSSLCVQNPDELSEGICLPQCLVDLCAEGSTCEAPEGDEHSPWEWECVTSED